MSNPITVAYNNFSRGIMDIDTDGRFDLPIYINGCKQCYNFYTNFKGNLILNFVQILMYAREIFTPAPLPEDAESIDKMRNKLKSVEVRKVYVQRKSTVESVFGIIKHVLGVRQFFLRSKEAVTGEWTLVPTA